MLAALATQIRVILTEIAQREVEAAKPKIFQNKIILVGTDSKKAMLLRPFNRPRLKRWAPTELASLLDRVSVMMMVSLSFLKRCRNIRLLGALQMDADDGWCGAFAIGFK